MATICPRCGGVETLAAELMLARLKCHRLEREVAILGDGE